MPVRAQSPDCRDLTFFLYRVLRARLTQECSSGSNAPNERRLSARIKTSRFKGNACLSFFDGHRCAISGSELTAFKGRTFDISLICLPALRRPRGIVRRPTALFSNLLSSKEMESCYRNTKVIDCFSTPLLSE